ncbi:MAG TPA: DUF1802 family protein [Acidimicrobiia bacterium]
MSGRALKEWAVVVHALLAGEQILDLRKGGLREDERRFSLQSPRFWLYPTVEHQHADLVKPAYRRWVEPPSSPDRLVVEGWADVAETTTITDRAVLDALESKVVWTQGYVESRFDWKHRQPLWVLALRAHRLIEPIEVPIRAEYVGCSSWVDVDELPDDPASVPSEPALTDESFTARLKLCADAIPGGFGD